MSPKQTKAPPPTSFAYVLGGTGTGGYRTYVGWTTDLEKRLERHNAGEGARATRGRQWRLLYAEGFQTRGQAMSREWHLKRERKFRLALADMWRDDPRARSGAGPPPLR